MFSPFLYFRSLKVKYRSLVICKIIRVIDKDKQLARTAILKAMMMLKKAWGEVNEQTLRNCFQRSGISLEAQEGTMDDHDDPFKGMVDDGEDISVVDELEFDLNQFCKARPDLAPENLDADGLVDFDREVATNEFHHCLLTKLLTNTFHSLFKPLEMGSSDEDEVPDKPIPPPSRNEVDKGIEILNRLTLFTTDPLLLKV